MAGACGGHLVQSPAQSRPNSEVRSKGDLLLSFLHPETGVLRSSVSLTFWPPSSVPWKAELRGVKCWDRDREREGDSDQTGWQILSSSAVVGTTTFVAGAKETCTLEPCWRTYPLSKMVRRLLSSSLLQRSFFLAYNFIQILSNMVIDILP